MKLGGDRYPFARGAEFGSIRFHQFKPWRGNSTDAGYFMWPAIRDDQAVIGDLYVSEVEKILAALFPNLKDA